MSKLKSNDYDEQKYQPENLDRLKKEVADEKSIVRNWRIATFCIALLLWIGVFAIPVTVIKLYLFSLSSLATLILIEVLIIVHCKAYIINGHAVVLYNGLFCKYIKINGKIVDECKVFIITHTVPLTYALKTGERLKASFFIRCSLRVNNESVSQDL